VELEEETEEAQGEEEEAQKPAGEKAGAQASPPDPGGGEGTREEEKCQQGSDEEPRGIFRTGCQDEPRVAARPAQARPFGGFPFRVPFHPPMLGPKRGIETMHFVARRDLPQPVPPQVGPLDIGFRPLLQVRGAQGQCDLDQLFHGAALLL
jgi:hypothetical protein